MNNPKVSVIIPVYNTEKYLRECLDSVVNQTVKDIEIICVDDGSTDSSLAILQEYESKDSRVKVYAQEKSNAGTARNVGLSKATGEYLAFLDSDDYYELFMLEHMLTCAHKRAADIVVCRFHIYDERTGKTSYSCWGVKMDRLPSKKVFSYYEIEQECFSSIMGCPWNKLFKRKLVTENKLRFQEQPVFNDAFFSYSAMISTNALTVLDESLICYRLRALSDSITDRRSEYMDCSYNLLRELKNFLVYSGVYEKYEQHFINYVIRVLHSDYTAKNRSPESKREMGEKIQSWLDEFQVNRHDLSYYYDLEKYVAILPKGLRPDIQAEVEKRRADRLQNHLDSKKKEADKLRHDLENSRKQSDTLRRELEKQEKESDTLRRQLEKQEKESDTLRRDLEKQKKRADTLRRDLEKQKKRADTLQYDLDCVHDSVSFRVGRVITWVPRKVRGGVWCFRDHGAGYTVRRTLYHMGLWKDEEE